MGAMFCKRSAEPDFDVEARFPCFAIKRNVDAIMEAVVLMLNVLCESPPVPTRSHYIGVN
jgi:hypothetical protein